MYIALCTWNPTRQAIRGGSVSQRTTRAHPAMMAGDTGLLLSFGIYSSPGRMVLRIGKFWRPWKEDRACKDSRKTIPVTYHQKTRCATWIAHALFRTLPVSALPAKWFLDPGQPPSHQPYAEEEGHNLLPKLIAVCAISVSFVPPCQCISPAGT